VRYQEAVEQVWRTVHDRLYVADKAKDNLQGLRHGHPSFLLGEAVQSL
jgi:hypothetical protein